MKIALESGKDGLSWSAFKARLAGRIAADDSCQPQQPAAAVPKPSRAPAASSSSGQDFYDEDDEPQVAPPAAPPLMSPPLFPRQPSEPPPRAVPEPELRRPRSTVKFVLLRSFAKTAPAAAKAPAPPQLRQGVRAPLPAKAMPATGPLPAKAMPVTAKPHDPAAAKEFSGWI